MSSPHARRGLGRSIAVYLCAALAVAALPSTSTARQAGSTTAWERRMVALNASPAAQSVLAQARALAAVPVPAALRGPAATTAPRDAAAAIAALDASLAPIAPVGDAAADAYLARVARLTASPAYQTYVGGLKTLISDPAFTAYVGLHSVSSQVPVRGGFWEALGNGLVVLGTGIVMTGAVVACGVSVVCAGAAIVGGTSIMVGTALIAAGNVQDTGLAPKLTIQPRGQVGYSGTRFTWQICYSAQAPDGLTIRWDTNVARTGSTPWGAASGRCLTASQVVLSGPGNYRIWAWVEFQGDTETDETTFRVI